MDGNPIIPILWGIHFPFWFFWYLMAMLGMALFLRNDWPAERWWGGTGASMLFVVALGMILVSALHSGVQLFLGYEFVVLGSAVMLFGAAGKELTWANLEASIKLFLPGQIFGAGLLMALNLPNGLGSFLAILALSFLAGLVPVHFWLPDAAQAAPRGVAAFVLSGTKSCGVMGLARFLSDHPTTSGVHEMVGTMALWSIVMGGLCAAPQRNVRRMLGYASISGSGMIVGGITHRGWMSDSEWWAVEISLVGWSLGLFAAFYVLELVEKPMGGVEMHRLAGLWDRKPVLAVILSLALFSLLGFPPGFGLVGLWGLVHSSWLHGNFGILGAMAIGQMGVLYGFLNVAKNIFWSAPRMN